MVHRLRCRSREEGQQLQVAVRAGSRNRVRVRAAVDFAWSDRLPGPRLAIQSLGIHRIV
jgi:hypothetical protein